MRILLIDPFHGAAGDMIVASLLSLGADQRAVQDAMDSVVNESTIHEVTRRGIRALQVDTCAGMEERTFDQVLTRVTTASASDMARNMAIRIFRRIQSAEEAVHGVPVHFHQVGADDAIAEVIGACVALESLHIDGVHILPIALGSGMIQTVHGTFPVPAPATAEILHNSSLPVMLGHGKGELCTPTGAAILSEFNVQRVDLPASSRMIAVGYGAGTNDDYDVPNVIRTVLLEADERLESDRVDILETNVDDVSGEVLGYTLERLIQEGARDVSIVPLLMKKGRPAHMIQVICEPPQSTALSLLLARELGTLGIRHLQAVHRSVVSRSVITIPVEIGGESRTLHIKCSWMENQLLGLKPEYEECRAWAKELGRPLRDVMRIVEDTARSRIRKEKG